MEETIEELINERYKNHHIKIKVKYYDIREYIIDITINMYYNIKFHYMYDCHLTLDSNIDSIINKVDKFIIKYYKEEEIR